MSVSYLLNYNCRNSSVELVGRISKNNPEPAPTPTILIIATWEALDDAWIDASRKIHEVLMQNGISGVAIEIADPLVFKPLYTFCIQKTDKIIWE